MKSKFSSLCQQIRKGLKRISLIPFLFTMFLNLPGFADDPLSITMERMTSIGSSIERYYSKTGKVPEADSIFELNEKLAPELDLPLPATDGWGREIHYITRNTGDSSGCCEYWIGSSGEKYRFDGFMKYILKCEKKGTDIIYSNGDFIVFPEDGKKG